MNNLIQVKTENGRQLVSARDLYKGLEVKKRFSAWVNQNFKEFIENEDFTSVLGGTVVKSGNGTVRRYDDYALTLEMAKELCMMSKTPKGKEVRKYFIEVEKRFKAQKNLANMDSYMIEDPIKRAKKWIAEHEELEKNKLLVEKQAKQLEDQEDDVIFSKAIGKSDHSITVREQAAILTQSGYVIGQNQLYELLRLKHFISKYSTLPMGSKIKLGYFRIKHGIKNGHAYSQTLITPKGQKHILSKCLRGTWDDAYQQVVANTLGI